METKIDHNASSLLTEEAYARSIGPATKIVPMPERLISFDEWVVKKTLMTVRQLSYNLYGALRLDYEQYMEDWESRCKKWEEWIAGYLRWRKISQKKNAAGENQHQLGPREFTFTYSPDWFEDDTDAQNAMRCAVEKLTRYYRDEIIEFHAVGEFTRDGRAHVHGMYHLDGGRKITDKNFKRAWKYWNPKRKLGKGFEGGHHQTINRTADFLGYMEKNLEEAWLDIHITNADDQEVQEVNVPTQGSP